MAKVVVTYPLAMSCAVRVMGVVVVPSLSVMTMPTLARLASNVALLVKVLNEPSSALLTNALLSVSVVMLRPRLISAGVGAVVSITTGWMS